MCWTWRNPTREFLFPGGSLPAGPSDVLQVIERVCVCVTDTSTDCGQHPLIDRTAIKESKAKKGVGGTCCDGGNRNEVGRQLGQITSSETGRKEVQRKRRAAKEKGYAII